MHSTKGNNARKACSFFQWLFRFMSDGPAQKEVKKFHDTQKTRILPLERLSVEFQGKTHRGIFALESG